MCIWVDRIYMCAWMLMDCKEIVNRLVRYFNICNNCITYAAIQSSNHKLETYPALTVKAGDLSKVGIRIGILFRFFNPPGVSSQVSILGQAPAQGRNLSRRPVQVW